MKRIHTIVCSLLLLVCGGHFGLLRAQSSVLTLDFGTLENRNVRLVGTGVDSTFSTKSAFVIGLDTGETYQLEVNPGNHLVSTVSFDFSFGGSISNVQWKDGDGSQTNDVFEPLSNDFFEVMGSSLNLNGATMKLNWAETSLRGVYWAELWDTWFEGVELSEELFPGDYEVLVGDGINGVGTCRLSFEVTDQAIWTDAVDWQPHRAFHDGSAPVWASLDTTYWMRTGGNATLELAGRPIWVEKVIDNKAIHFSNLDDDLNLTVSDTIWFFPGNIDGTIGSGDGLAAWFTAFYDPDIHGILDTIKWFDPDSSMTPTGLLSLAPNFAHGGTDTLYFGGKSVDLNFSNNDQTEAFAQVDGSTLQSGYNALSLFPGNYEIRFVGTSTIVSFELDATGQLGQLQYRDYQDPSVPAGRLGQKFATVAGDSIDFHGRAMVFDLTALTTHTMSFEYNAVDPIGLTASDSTVRNLMPGYYLLDMFNINDSKSDFLTLFRIQNEAGGMIEGPLRYKDLALSGQPWEPDGIYASENIYARQGTISWYFGPDSNIATPYTTTYAQLKRQPDGAWYKLDNDTLHLSYEGEYDAGALALKILDWERMDVTPGALSLQKNHGHNQYSLGLGSLSQGHYMLEVTNEKNETFYLRFEVD